MTSISDGLSGAGVYRVDTARGAFVLKVAPDTVALARWRRPLAIWQRAAAAGLTPALVHVDEARRAVVTPYVVDRSFAVLYRDPLSHERCLAEIGQTLRRVHTLPLPSEGESADAAASPWTLTAAWGALTTAGIAVPDFVYRAAEVLLEEVPPDSGRALVLSHNDVHPKNLVHDGARFYLMDWDAAGLNDPFYDLATIAVFLGMNGSTCRKLLNAYDAAPDAPPEKKTPLPERFLYDRRLIAVLCGVGFLQFGFHSGYTAGAGAAGGESLESIPSLREFYTRMRAGTLSLATGEGRWAFGLALVREGAVTFA